MNDTEKINTLRVEAFYKTLMYAMNNGISFSYKADYLDDQGIKFECSDTIITVNFEAWEIQVVRYEIEQCLLQRESAKQRDLLKTQALNKLSPEERDALGYGGIK